MGLCIGVCVIFCSVGCGGFSVDKCEGDGVMLIGLYCIVGVLYCFDCVVWFSFWVWLILLGDLWCDVLGYVVYNYVVCVFFVVSYEVMWWFDLLYDIVLLIDWNWFEGLVDCGLVIFLYQWCRLGFLMVGCIVMVWCDLIWLVG